MAVVRLQNLPWSASAQDVRNFFSGLDIPNGGVRIIGGEDGDCFVSFISDPQAHDALRKDRTRLNNQQIRLRPSSAEEMRYITAVAKGEAPPKPTPPVYEREHSPHAGFSRKRPSSPMRNERPSKYGDQRGDERYDRFERNQRSREKPVESNDGRLFQPSGGTFNQPQAPNVPSNQLGGQDGSQRGYGNSEGYNAKPTGQASTPYQANPIGSGQQNIQRSADINFRGPSAPQPNIFPNDRDESRNREDFSGNRGREQYEKDTRQNSHQSRSESQYRGQQSDMDNDFRKGNRRIPEQQNNFVAAQVPEQQKSFVAGHTFEQQDNLAAGRFSNQQNNFMPGRRVPDQQSDFTPGAGRIPEQQKHVASGRIHEQQKNFTPGPIPEQQKNFVAGRGSDETYNQPHHNKFQVESTETEDFSDQVGMQGNDSNVGYRDASRFPNQLFPEAASNPSNQYDGSKTFRGGNMTDSRHLAHPPPGQMNASPGFGTQNESDGYDMPSGMGLVANRMNSGPDLVPHNQQFKAQFPGEAGDFQENRQMFNPPISGNTSSQFNNRARPNFDAPRFGFENQRGDRGNPQSFSDEGPPVPFQRTPDGPPSGNRAHPSVNRPMDQKSFPSDKGNRLLQPDPFRSDSREFPPPPRDPQFPNRHASSANFNDNLLDSDFRNSADSAGNNNMGGSAVTPSSSAALLPTPDMNPQSVVPLLDMNLKVVPADNNRNSNFDQPGPNPPFPPRRGVPPQFPLEPNTMEAPPLPFPGLPLMKSGIVSTNQPDTRFGDLGSGGPPHPLMSGPPHPQMSGPPRPQMSGPPPPASMLYGGFPLQRDDEKMRRFSQGDQIQHDKDERRPNFESRFADQNDMQKKPSRFQAPQSETDELESDAAPIVPVSDPCAHFTNLPGDVQFRQLRGLFATHDVIAKDIVINWPQDRQKNADAVVLFEGISSTITALNDLRGMKISGHVIEITPCSKSKYESMQRPVPGARNPSHTDKGNFSDRFGRDGNRRNFDGGRRSPEGFGNRRRSISPARGSHSRSKMSPPRRFRSPPSGDKMRRRSPPRRPSPSRRPSPPRRPSPSYSRGRRDDKPARGDDRPRIVDLRNSISAKEPNQRAQQPPTKLPPPAPKLPPPAIKIVSPKTPSEDRSSIPNILPCAVFTGLPSKANLADLEKLLDGSRYTKKSLYIEFNVHSECTGTAYVELASEQDQKKLMNSPRETMQHTVHISSVPSEKMKSLVEEHRDNLAADRTKPGEFVLQLLGLPLDATPKTVTEFFFPTKTKENEVTMMKLNDGRCSGSAFVKVHSLEDRDAALKHDRGYIGKRYVTVRVTTEQAMNDFIAKAISSLPTEPSFTVRPDPDSARTIRLVNLRYDIKPQQVEAFFKDYNPQIGTVRFQMLNGMPNGKGSVMLKTAADARKAVEHLNKRELAGRPLLLSIH